MFKLLKTAGRARRGEYSTRHGVIQTPVFMNVGTSAAIKGGLSCDDLLSIGCQVELSNTYHLYLRPGEQVVAAMGGLHGFMKWDKPVLTDSGGFQVFSLARLRKINEEGVFFNSHIDGHSVFMGPEESINIQYALGADIIMAFDECVANPATRDYVRKSADRTTRWLERCIARSGVLRTDNPPDLWGINQGGTFDDLRVEHIKRISEFSLPGYAVGGLAVGEETAVMYHILDILEEHMPTDKPRYLMGVGTPGNILEAVSRGIDFFDCVMPARNARHGHLYTWDGFRNIKNERYKTDSRPIDEKCRCPVCTRYSRAYLRHLFMAGEILALRLNVMHNLYFYNNLMKIICESIENGTFKQLLAYAEILDGKAQDI